MKKGPIIIRFVLGLGLIFRVYTETGGWTALSLFLILIGMEAQGYLINKNRVR